MGTNYTISIINQSNKRVDVQLLQNQIDSLLIENSSFVADTSGGEGGAIQLSDKNQFVKIL